MDNERLGQTFFIEDRGEIEKDQDNNWSNYGFSRDLSRIIFSNSYRRMAGKTQIFPAYENEHMMTRLTHTLIVNNIAMDIAQRANNCRNYEINIDLIQAIANGHDIGHTPFGHAGERALNDKTIDKDEQSYFDKNYYFRHNIFSVNILQNLDKIKSLDYGYNLSWQVVDGILKHTDLSNSKENENVVLFQLKNKFLESNQFKKALKEISDQSYINYPYPLTIEGQIVKMADEIAQYYHDVLDLSRHFNDKSILAEFIGKIFSETKEIEKDISEKKFYSTFTDENKEIKKEKLYDLDNREFFANEIKELFINEVVKCLTDRKKIKRVNIGEKEGRFIVENVFFEICEDKVIPNFSSKFVKKVSEIFIDYRKKLISEDNSIVKYDSDGKINIEKAMKEIIDSQQLFELYCGNDFIHYLNTICDKNEYLFKLNDKEIYKNNINKNRKEILSGIFKYVNEDDSDLQCSDTMKKKLINLFYGTIIEAIARMTDHYIIEEKYKEKLKINN